MTQLTILEKILMGIVGTIMLGWSSWLSVTVVGLASKQREDTAQWKKMERLESRINKFHSEGR